MADSKSNNNNNNNKNKKNKQCDRNITQADSLPPLNEKSLKVFNQRLAAAEEDAHFLSRHLSTMISDDSNTVPRPYDSETTDLDTTRTSDVSSCSTKTRQSLKHADDFVLTSRLAKAECTVNNLKQALNVLRCGEGGEDGVNEALKSPVKLQDGVSVSQLQHDELICLRQELKLEREAKNKAYDEIRNLKESLIEAYQTKTDTSNKIAVLEAEKQNLVDSLSEIEKELIEERNSHENLELFHLSLLNKVEQLKTLVDSEKKEVRDLTDAHQRQQMEIAGCQTKLKEERKLRSKIEKNYQMLLAPKKSTEEKQANKTLQKEFTTLTNQYTTLLEQMGHLQNCFKQQHQNSQDLECLQEEMSKALESSKKECKHLQNQNIIHKQNEKKFLSEIKALKFQIVSVKSENEALEKLNQKLEDSFAKLEEELKVGQNMMYLEAGDVLVCKNLLTKDGEVTPREISCLQIEKTSLLAEKLKIQLQERDFKNEKIPNDGTPVKKTLSSLEWKNKLLEAGITILQN
ncbi:paramyosin isoform X2 [Octopus sinensis]|nr:paramyosin isoform X2 [Octopus sinensis]